MTCGGVNNFCGESAGQGEVFDEILAGLEAFGAITPYEPYRHFTSGNRKFEHDILMKEDRKTPPYQIPLRSLYARDCANLWMAGRNLSADSMALSSARVATSGAMMGQAVGIAAAIASRGDMDCRATDARAVRDTVSARGAILDK